MKAKIILLLIAMAAIFSGCKKGDKGDTGPMGATGATGATGPEAQYYDFSIPVSSSTYSGSYSLAGTTFDGDDVVITYWKEFSTGWLVQTPYIYYQSPTSVGINIWAEVASITLFINTTKADGQSGSPWAGAGTLDFRVVIIKSHSLHEHPEVNLANYQDVKQTFNLTD